MKKGTDISYHLKKSSKVLIALVLLFGVLFLFHTLILQIGIHQVFNYVTERVARTGVNIYLAKGIIALSLIPLFFGFKWALSLFPKKRKRGFIIIGGYIVAFYIAMFFLTKEQKFDYVTGEALKYYANTPEGIRCFDSPGYDPKYNIPLKPVTSEMAINEAKRKSPLKKIKHPTQFFDHVTGESRVWYYEPANGTFEFYDQPGFHPVFAEELLPVTPEVVERYKQALLPPTPVKKRVTQPAW